MSDENKSEDSPRDVRTAVNKLRRDVTIASKDIASASKAFVESTSKFVKEVSPKLSATIDESLEKASDVFTRTMTDIGLQTRPQQVKLLKAYRTFLSKQVGLIEKRLEKLKK